MIGVKLWGGLGNQMFQYAFGLYMAEKRGEKQFFFTEINKNHNLDIDYFKVSIEYFATEALTKYDYYFQNYFLYRLNRKLFQLIPFLNKEILVENVSPFRPDILDSYSLFDGYWQSYKYIQPIEQNLREQFVLKANPISDMEIFNAISDVNSVSLHIRRGDYLKGKNSKIYENISMDYYAKAIDYFSEKIVNPIFYIFSNDLDWTKENLELPIATKFFFIDNSLSENSAIADLYLMSSCKHHIIANSTFSWWGAWLNPSKQKLVIAPKKWYIGKMNDLSLDLIPTEWERF
jgi:Glycosyl transferase family 11